MTTDSLKTTLRHLLTAGKGILAADESPTNIGKKFQILHMENTPENRRKYREILFTAPGIEHYISGIILHEETLHQYLTSGEKIPLYLKRKHILSGLKVDLGLRPFRDDPIETVTEGLESLGDRLAASKECGVCFAKWRSVIHIDESLHKPSIDAISENLERLADYADISQQHDIVPILEPEVLMDGQHDIETSFHVTLNVLTTLFKILAHRHIDISTILLKPNMVIPGLMCPSSASPEQVAEKTIRCLKESVPSKVPGIVFLSGGQSDALSVHHLALMNQYAYLPWVLSFSYGRALQRQALTTWKGQDSQIENAQQMFIQQARLSSLATLGKIVTDEY